MGKIIHKYCVFKHNLNIYAGIHIHIYKEGNIYNVSSATLGALKINVTLKKDDNI